MLEGIDVAIFQGVIDWQKVLNSGKVQFAICKATDSWIPNKLDSSFKRNWAGIKSVGLVRGAYHFAHTIDSAEKEADLFASQFIKLNDDGTKTVILPLEYDDILALDMESSNLFGDQFVLWVLTWLTRIEELLGVTPILYTGGPFFNAHCAKASKENIDKLTRFPLWLAAYTKSPDKYIPLPWKSVGWTIWQVSGEQAAPGEVPLHVPGINIVVDRNIFNGTVEDLRFLAANLHPAKNNVFSEVFEAFEKESENKE